MFTSTFSSRWAHATPLAIVATPQAPCLRLGWNLARPEIHLDFVSFVCFVDQKHPRTSMLICVHLWFKNNPKSQAQRLGWNLALPKNQTGAKTKTRAIHLLFTPSFCSANRCCCSKRPPCIIFPTHVSPPHPRNQRRLLRPVRPGSRPISPSFSDYRHRFTLPASPVTRYIPTSGA